MTRASCIFRGVVQHRRRAPTAHQFRYSLYMLYLDLAEVDSLFAGRWFFSHERANVFSFRRKDYLGDAKQPLGDAVREVVQHRLGVRPTGPIRMLTHIRSFGYVFNPVTFYYCFTEDERIEAIVAEITNTPWGERHAYVFATTDEEALEFEFGKEFHISPFMRIEQRYRWRFTRPGDFLTVHMTNTEGGEQLFEVSLTMQRREITGLELARTVVRHPAMAARAIAGVYWQAFRLWLKRTPFHPHPKNEEVRA